MKTNPPRPSTWNLTIEDLIAEISAGKRASIKQPELDWARDYEASLIPANVRFPRKGDLYEALEDTMVTYMTVWAAPCSGSGKAVLKKGEEVLIDYEPNQDNPIGVYAVAVNYLEIETRMVPEQDRLMWNYGGFHLSLKTVDLNTKFRLKQTACELRIVRH